METTEAGPRYHAAEWSIELAPGWQAEERGDHVALLSGRSHTLLRICTFRPTDPGMTAEGWAEQAAEVHRPRGRLVTPITCGAFTGFRTEFEATDRWLRGWMLSSGETPLDATYTCPTSDAGLEDRDVDAMLATLAVEPLREEAAAGVVHG
jgi:hypothetical protein